MAQILHIEPDSLLAETYTASLELAGHSVDAVTSAQAGIHAADKITPDLVLLELQLVEHSGVEFLYEFRSYPEWQSIPVIVLSNVPPAEFSGSHDLLTHELGVQAYQYKPQTSLRQLLALINELAAVAT